MIRREIHHRRGFVIDNLYQLYYNLSTLRFNNFFIKTDFFCDNRIFRI